MPAPHSEPPSKPEPGAPSLLVSRAITPMDAVVDLYSEGHEDVARAIVASLERRIFEGELPKPASFLRRRMAALVFRLLKRTTRLEFGAGSDAQKAVRYRNPILERSRHPYALNLLAPSGADTAAFVEGGDPMNAIYMMLSPEISGNAGTWDRILLGSVQSTDVQLRFAWETRMTHDFATRKLSRGEPVRLKAVAAGTGLSLILVADRLLREGHDPKLLTATITDRDPANIEKALRLLRKLDSTRPHLTSDIGAPQGIGAHVEDLLHPSPFDGKEAPCDVVTLVGILEYFPGFTCATTEEHLGETPAEESFDAEDLIRKIHEMTADGGILIANSYRVEIGARIIEIFGKRLRYRNRKELHALVGTTGFVPTGHFGSGHVYDVEVFAKRSGCSAKK